MSWRAVVLVVILVLALAVALPSLRAFARQTDRLNELQARAEAARTEVADLEAELARWADPAFVQAQARERLGYVLPGETPYRVIDPETVVRPEDIDPAAAEIPVYNRTPWFATLWESLADPEGT